MKLFPSRSKAEKREDVRGSIFHLAFWGGVSAISCLSFWLFSDVVWIVGIGLFVAIIGIYCVFQSAMELAVQMSLGTERFVAIIGGGIILAALVNGYWLITSP